jgi:hypothetical protein
MIQTIKNATEPDYRLGAEKFCYWLQGFFEMTNAETMTPEQVKMVKEHLHLVFTHKVAIPAVSQTQATGSSVLGSIVGSGTEMLTTVC